MKSLSHRVHFHEVSKLFAIVAAFLPAVSESSSLSTPSSVLRGRVRVLVILSGVQKHLTWFQSVSPNDERCRVSFCVLICRACVFFSDSLPNFKVDKLFCFHSYFEVLSYPEFRSLISYAFCKKLSPSLWLIFSLS